MKVEEETILYLHKYGNTREHDIINYGVKKFSCSPEEMKKFIKRMVVKGKIHYVIHSKLKPPEAYISLREPLPPEIDKVLLEAFVQMKAAKEDVQKILEEAAAIAGQKSKKK